MYLSVQGQDCCLAVTQSLRLVKEGGEGINQLVCRGPCTFPLSVYGEGQPKYCGGKRDTHCIYLLMMMESQMIVLRQAIAYVSTIVLFPHSLSVHERLIS